jgi:signal transduction histidine kinase
MFLAMNSDTTTSIDLTSQAKQVSIADDKNYLERDNDLQNLLNSLSVPTAVLNKERQILMANESMNDIARGFVNRDIFKLRHGDVMNCKFSKSEPGGCGTTEHCRYCGALRAVLLSRQHNAKVSEECRMIVMINEKEVSADYLVTASPLTWCDRHYFIISLTDISHEKRRRIMERIFFHDLINKSGSLQGFLELLKIKTLQYNEDKFLNIAETITRDLVEEVLSYRMLLEAENNELTIIENKVVSIDILQTVKNQLSFHKVAADKEIEISADSETTTIMTEPVLLNRILTNMLKNALEASESGDTVKVGCRKINNRVKFWVQNPAVMSEDVKMQVFYRNFSTKGSNRGLGTYSIKLLGETYLKGEVSFTSMPGEGTIFSITLPLAETPI